MPLDKRLSAVRPDLADERLRALAKAERYVKGVPARVVAPSAPVRREPRPDAALDTEALSGEAVMVFEKRDGFAWVQLEADGYVGYVAETTLGEPGPAPSHRVAVARTFVYPAADMKRPPDAALPLGSEVTVTATQGDFAELAGGGFVWAGHVAPLARLAPDYVAVAESLTGAPYLWGGRTPGGIDCSGLVQLAMAMAGLAVPRDSDMQRDEVGTELAPGTRDGLRRGDLVFWRGHVGIMQDERRLLHANGFHMLVASEPLAEAEARIEAKSFGPVTAIRRPGRLGRG